MDQIGAPNMEANDKVEAIKIVKSLMALAVRLTLLGDAEAAKAIGRGTMWIVDHADITFVDLDL